MDTSSELVHSLLPVFLVSVLGASITSVGLIEGVAEATAPITKIFSGTLSDYLGRRKALTVLGYGLAAITKPLFPLAGSVGTVLTARFIDRIGKGTRGAPRDALVADLSPPHLRGASFGLRQSLDTIGAFAGPVVAVAAMGLVANDIRAVFWIAVIPALMSIAILVAFVNEPDRRSDAGSTRVALCGLDSSNVGRSIQEVTSAAGELDASAQVRQGAPALSASGRIQPSSARHSSAP